MPTFLEPLATPGYLQTDCATATVTSFAELRAKSARESVGQLGVVPGRESAWHRNLLRQKTAGGLLQSDATPDPTVTQISATAQTAAPPVQLSVNVSQQVPHAMLKVGLFKGTDAA